MTAYEEHKKTMQNSELYKMFKELLITNEAQQACLSVLEWEYGWEGR